MAGPGRVLRLALLALALAALGAAFFVPVDPTPDGGRTLGGWMLAMGGVCALLLFLGELLRQPVLGYLCAVFVLGTCCQLGLTHPHWLQALRLRPWELAEGHNRWFLLGLLFQATTVLARTARERWEVPRAILHLLRPTQWLVVLVVFVAAAAHATRFLPEGRVAGWLFQLAVTAALVLLDLLHLVQIGRALTPFAATSLGLASGLLLTLQGNAERPARLDRALPWLGAGFVLVLCTQLTWLVFDRMPHIPDEISYLFMAKCFAQGRLSVPAPPVPEAFQVYLLELTGAGRWYSTPPFGWPAVLALGELVGMPWLVNPLLAAATVPVVHALVRRLLDVGTAHLVALLLTTSPWFLFLGASYMTHPLSLLLFAAALLLLARVRAEGGVARALLAGLLIGWLFLVRPLEGLVTGAALGLWCLGVCGTRLPLAATTLFAAGAAVTAALALPYNLHFTGHAFEFPINAYTARLWAPNSNSLGFGPDKGPPGGWNLDPYPGHGWRDVLLNTNQNLYCLNFELCGWAVGSLLLPLVHLLRGRLERTDRFCLLLIGVMFAAYSCYWYSGGPEFGARYWYLMILPLLWLAARGATTLTAVLAQAWPRSRAGVRVATALVVSMLLALLCFVPWRAVGRYRDFRGFHPGYRELAERERMGRSLVLVKTRDASLYDTDFASALVLNDPALSDLAPVFARDLGPEAEARLRTAFPDRPVWKIASRTVAGGAPQVVERPSGR